MHAPFIRSSSPPLGGTSILRSLSLRPRGRTVLSFPWFPFLFRSSSQHSRAGGLIVFSFAFIALSSFRFLAFVTWLVGRTWRRPRWSGRLHRNLIKIVLVLSKEMQKFTLVSLAATKTTVIDGLKLVTKTSRIVFTRILVLRTPKFGWTRRARDIVVVVVIVIIIFGDGTNRSTMGSYWWYMSRERSV